MAKTVTLYKKLFLKKKKNLESKKKKLTLTLSYYVSREIWLGNSRKLKILHFLTPARIQKCLT